MATAGMAATQQPTPALARPCSPAGNQLAVLRILCATHSWEAAEQLVAATQDPAAAFHLARLHEARGDVPGALRCYGISKRIVHGARLAKR
jgi:intraflagellar transport protein 140